MWTYIELASRAEWEARHRTITPDASRPAGEEGCGNRARRNWDTTDWLSRALHRAQRAGRRGAVAAAR